MTTLAIAVAGVAIAAGVAMGTVYCMLRDLTQIFPVREIVTYRWGGWRWQIISASGEPLFESTEVYQWPSQARKAVRQIAVDGLEP